MGGAVTVVVTLSSRGWIRDSGREAVLTGHIPGCPVLGGVSAGCGRGSLWGYSGWSARGSGQGDSAGRTPRHPRCLPRRVPVLCGHFLCPASHRVIHQVLAVLVDRTGTDDRSRQRVVICVAGGEPASAPELCDALGRGALLVAGRRRVLGGLGASYDLRVAVPTSLARGRCQRFRMRTSRTKRASTEKSDHRGL
jgi:hypothetical protein